ncbi:MAG: GtrA family protein [Clostridia bacterium]|nr:GtrA family protein [Clostridia bacterium]
MSMMELFDLVIRFKWKELMIAPTKNGLVQFFRYAFVGGIATIVDWSVQFFVTNAGVHYLLVAIFAFLAGLICNFLLSKLFVFQAEKANMNLSFEFVSYAIIGIIGLGITMAIMYFITEKLAVSFMISKMIATAIVLVWNFLARKVFIYQQ